MKQLYSLILCLLMIAGLSCAVSASDGSAGAVVDDAELLSSYEEAKLTEQALEIYRQTGIWVAIVTTDSLGMKSSERYADDYYDQNYYSTYKDGILLLIAMETREWAISTCGEGISQFSDRELDNLFYAMSDDLAYDDFYSAFTTFLDQVPSCIRQGSRTKGLGDVVPVLLISLLIGAAAGGIGILIMRGQMNTVRPQSNAGNYLVQGSYRLKKHFDIFLYSRVTRIRKPDNHGGSSHRSSGGVRHGGRSGRF